MPHFKCKIQNINILNYLSTPDADQTFFMFITNQTYQQASHRDSEFSAADSEIIHQ